MPGKIRSFDPSTLCQVAIVVKSIDATVKFYGEVFGIGPFEIRDVEFPNATYYGQKAGYRGKRAFAQLGPVTLELIELIDGKTVHEDFLKEKGYVGDSEEGVRLSVEGRNVYVKLRDTLPSIL